MNVLRVEFIWFVTVYIGFKNNVEKNRIKTYSASCNTWSIIKFTKKKATATKNNLLVVKLTNFYSNCNIPSGERQQQNMHTDTYFNGYINGQSFWSWLTIQFDDQHMFHTNYNAMHSIVRLPYSQIIIEWISATKFQFG